MIRLQVFLAPVDHHFTNLNYFIFNILVSLRMERLKIIEYAISCRAIPSPSFNNFDLFGLVSGIGQLSSLGFIDLVYVGRDCHSVVRFEDLTGCLPGIGWVSRFQFFEVFFVAELGGEVYGFFHKSELDVLFAEVAGLEVVKTVCYEVSN